jgi:hypothetical protein
MHVLVAHSQPRGKYGCYVFTVMIHFAEETETAEIGVFRPETQTKTVTKYSCGYCGRWTTIVTHQTIPVNTLLQAKAHQKDGKLELYRYDNVEPDDFIELILRDSMMFKYQITKISIGQHDMKMKSYWRLSRHDKLRQRLEPGDGHDAYKSITGKEATFVGTNGKIYSHSDYDNWYTERRTQWRRLKKDESPMTNEFLYHVNLLNWDGYVEARPTELGEVRVEEELIQQTMNAEEITIKELVLSPASNIPTIQGETIFIEGELKYLE